MGRRGSRLAAAGLLLCMLAGCLRAQELATDQQAVFDDLSAACHAYASALRVAATANASGRLNDEQVATVDMARAIINPVCDGPAPLEPSALRVALSTIQSSLYDLIVLSQSLEAKQ